MTAGQRDPWCNNSFTSTCAVNCDPRVNCDAFAAPTPWSGGGVKVRARAPAATSKKATKRSHLLPNRKLLAAPCIYNTTTGRRRIQLDRALLAFPHDAAF